MGEAVGFMRECKADLRSIQHSSLAKPHLRKSAVAGRALKEEESVSEMLQRYTMINDTVSGSTKKAMWMKDSIEIIGGISIDPFSARFTKDHPQWSWCVTDEKVPVTPTKVWACT